MSFQVSADRGLAPVRSSAARAALRGASPLLEGIRDFAKSMGKCAKTDPIDAAVLAHLAEVVPPRPCEVMTPERALLRELLIYAFFYVEGMQQGRVKAQYDQVRYHAAYGQSIPVVRIKFPTDKDQLMVFTYADEDQAVGKPVPTAKIDFESEALGKREEFTVDGVTFKLHGPGGISNEPHERSKGLISGKHLNFENEIEIVLPGKGRRQVSYNWGCSDHCMRDTMLTENYKVLTEGQGVYGTDQFIVDGPEIMTLYIGDDGENKHMVIDDLEVTEAPEK